MDKQTIFLIDDEVNVVKSLKSGLETHGLRSQIFTDGASAIEKLKHEKPAVVVTDILMPDMDGIELIKKMKRIAPDLSFVVMTAHASLDSAIEALRLGVIDYLVKPFKLNDLASTIQKASSQTRLMPKVSGLNEFQERYKLKNLIGQSPNIKEVFALVSRIAKKDATVLILGESGTGKEMIARAIHYNSKRKNASFVSVNCAALPENLLESELFGYDKGAFTGAIQSKQGLFEVAKGGTFFLDEIGEIPLSLQAKLLRVLQERTIKHLGGIRDIEIDVRVIAATSKNLNEEVKENRFREDLFYRLNVVPISLPPLRERITDIPELISCFLRIYTRRHGIQREFKIAPDGLDYLKSREWPGNIRELENLVERIVMLQDQEMITKEALALLGQPQSINQPANVEDKKAGEQTLSDAVEKFEKEMIEEALKNSKGNKNKAAIQLGLTRQNLQYKLKKYHLD
ncbi:MAG: hypothetical protein COV74_01590 [Candidatus Omnitrophica bacterium CG11_big_fil_rev_8_21_14_0_20_45_26]|uniref:DNA-binding response regulator n=1 Tax=Candidatus Abzuiibacterium crystallinum TaxID=1974748 RepID=A0A2H0LSB2_9BACT|nr:MAG: hypothetical protein COV74_01590 [Candidatus Omnitrophica bacterium CG11_big_fil_rev_8_21_14_0_20_45_26]PIW64990.1 MAG: hypothetical protein COW12_03870 [Candidatus Omnitrophica bacterium CG12_big_fil_rev_8_21_14_0_65_45_16]